MPSLPLASGPAFPTTRLRRLRRTPWLRHLVQEVRLHPSDLVWPIFVIEGQDRTEPVGAMPGVERVTLDRLPALAAEAAGLGIPALALFPVLDPGLKTPDGAAALDPQGLCARAVRMVKQAVPEIGVIVDIALDPYTSHGHDGLIRAEGQVLNDPTLEVLGRQALVLAEAGADIVAPSDMMDGRVGHLRRELDQAGFQEVAILSYAAKYASAFYGPFREAVGSGGLLTGDKKGYQMDPANRGEALREIALDVAEGADMLMVKPGLPYLDVIARVAEATGLPVLAYQVSGEYAMLQAAAERGWLDRDRALMEMMLGFKRAGATAVFSYFAPHLARLLRG